MNNLYTVVDSFGFIVGYARTAEDAAELQRQAAENYDNK